MQTVYIRNGFIFLKDFEKEYPWVTYSYNDGDPYFLLTSLTRYYFKRDILPLIKAGEVIISRETLDFIKTFRQNPEIPALGSLTQPSGIILKPHQKEAVERMLTHNSYAFFLGPGTGKTLIAISFFLSAGITSGLIVTPPKVISQYKQELDKYIPGNNFVVTNYEQLHKFEGNHYDTLILDESHKVKNYSSKMNESCRIIAKRCDKVYLFTGTPQDKSRHEILPQLAILDSRVMPGKTRTYERYFHFNDYYQPSKEKIEFSAELTTLIGEYSWGRQTEEVINLCKENNYIVSCEYPEGPYEMMLKDRFIKDADNFECVADNKGILKVALREICSGHLKLHKLTLGPDGNPFKVERILHFLPDKFEKLCHLCSKLPCGIIYYDFTADLKTIEETMSLLKLSYKIINGSTARAESGKIVDAFKRKEFNWLVMQSKSGNAGLDLTIVNNIIFYDLPESYIVYSQCKYRINRIGQTQECNYWHLICKDSVEEQQYKALKRKKSFSNDLFKIYKEK